MAAMDAAWMQELLEMFRVEGIEHIKAIAEGLVSLEQTGEEGNGEALEVIYREAHSLKGAARSIGLTEIESVCQSLEDVLAAYKHGQTVPDSRQLDCLHMTLEALGEHIRNNSGLDVSSLVARLKSLCAGSGQTGDEPAPRAEVTRESLHENKIETLRIAVERMDRLMLSAEELTGPKLAIDHLASALRGLVHRVAEWRETATVARPWRAGDEGGTENNPQGTLNEQMLLLESDLGRISAVADAEARRLSSMVNHLVDELKHTLMLPFDHLLKLMPTTVRDVARAQDKKVRLTQEGGQIEIDRRILEELKDPLIHLLRNSVDHGIELPAERLAAGKPETGRMGLSIVPLDEGKVEIRLWDDGRGIDVEAVKTAAVRKGFIDQETADGLDERSARELIFLSEMSTRPMITALSGRGLGLAIVREKVEKLGGHLVLESELGKGTTFRMVLPVTQATFRGIVVQVSGRTVVLPTHSVVRTGRVPHEEIRSVEGRLAILDGDRHIPYHRLSYILELPESVAPRGLYQQMVVVSAQDQRVALGVDEVIREQEVLVKNLGKELVRVRNVAGATVLGDGHIAPILNGADLVLSAQKKRTTGIPAKTAAAPAPKTIMVVEDSITTRTLLKNMLSAAGYRVRTAVDGMDAFAALHGEPVDLLVSDVEMPRMNGFDLISRLRSHPRFARLPVVLVTALENREHRERGLEVGANAYLPKGQFEQGNLLSVIRQLV